MKMGMGLFKSATAVVMSVVLASSLSVGAAVAGQPSYAAGTVSETVMASDSALSTQAATTGWKNTSAGKMYLKKGEAITGLQKVNGAYYYFNSKGIMRTSDITLSGATFYMNDDGKIFGAKYGGKYYYGNMKPMTSDDNYDFDTFIWARQIVKSITNAGDSSETKLHKCFDWVMNKYYEIHSPEFNAYERNWPARFARYHFANQGGDCHADASAFAYLAAAIGYPADACLDAVGVGTMSSHAWAMIGNKVYDPLFAQSKSYWGYYGVTSGTYETNPTVRVRVPQYKASNNASAAVSQDLLNAGALGLKKIGGSYYYFLNGKKLRNTWKTIDGKRYYFKSSGAAATLSTKVNGAYYVFNSTGVLQKSAKSGKRIITIGKNSYQVNKAGKAVAGWSKNHKKYAKANGLVLKKTWKTINGKRYYFEKDGTRATYSTKVNGTYYVFGASGALQKAAKGSSALVTVGKRTYRVDKAGRAVASASGEWLKGAMQRFDKTGMLLTGVWFIGKKFYAASKAGVYKPEATAQLNAAVKGYAKSKKSALDLRRALDAAGAKLKTEVYSASCDAGVDYDGLWEYAHFAITTARSKGVKKAYQNEGYKSVSDAIAAIDAAIAAAHEATEAEEADLTGEESTAGDTDEAADSGATTGADSATDQPADSVDPTPEPIATDVIAADGSYEYIRSITAL